MSKSGVKILRSMFEYGNTQIKPTPLDFQDQQLAVVSNSIVDLLYGSIFIFPSILFDILKEDTIFLPTGKTYLIEEINHF